MLITCPQCKTTYNVPSIVDKPEQRVRCAKCGCVWEPGSETIDMSLLDFSLEKETEKFHDIPMPAFGNYFSDEEKRGNVFLKWLKPLYFFSLFCIAVSIYLFFFQSPRRAYVTLQPVSYEIVQKDYKQYLLLQAAAFNNTDKEILPEEFVVLFADEDDKTLTTIALDSPVNRLLPRDITKIDFQIERPPSHTAKVVLTLTKMQML